MILTETATVNCDIVARVVSIRGKFKGIIQADRVNCSMAARWAANVNSFYISSVLMLRCRQHPRRHDDRCQTTSTPADPAIPVLIDDASSGTPPTFPNA